MKETENSLSEPFNDGRRVVLERVRRWGMCASDAILDPNSLIYSHPEINGLIGYRVELGCAIVFGDPVCARHEQPQLAHSFHQFCKEQRMNVVYVITSEQFAKSALEKFCKGAVEFGHQLFVDPHNDPRQGSKGQLIRKKVKHATHEGLKVYEHLSPDREIEKAMEKVGNEWLQARRGIQVYISQIRLFDDRFGKRWFYAKQGEQIVGVLALNQLQERGGWMIHHLMALPDAPNGTSEMLVVSVLELLAKEGCHFFSFGVTPAEKLGEISGFGTFSTRLTREAFKVARKVFHLEGRKKYWEKFQPQSERTFILFSDTRIGLSELWGLLRALNISF